MNSLNRISAIFTCIGAFAFYTPSSLALPLGEIAGQTELQSTTGNGVQAVCGNFASGATPVANASQQDLFDRCRQLVQTESDGAESLNLSDDDLNAALQNVTTEEAANVGTVATETSSSQLKSIAGRISALRAGALGFTVAGFDLQDAQLLSAADLGLEAGATGGAAGDESSTTPWNKLGVFLNGNGSFGDKDSSSREDGFDFHSAGMTTGIDYRFTDNLILGGAFGYNAIKTDFDNRNTVRGGSVDVDSFNFSLYGTYYAENFYVDGIATYGWADNEIKRRIGYDAAPGAGTGASVDRRARADTDSNYYSLSLGGGYLFNQAGLTFGPYARFNYLDMNIDGYRETGADGLNLKVDTQEVRSLTSGLGVRANYAISTKFGVLQPQIEGEWVHEFKDSSRVIRASYVNDPNAIELEARTDNPDRNYFNFGAGVSALFGNGAQAFFFYRSLLGHQTIIEHAFTLGIRVEL